jgi:hypothetical protein
VSPPPSKKVVFFNKYRIDESGGMVYHFPRTAEIEQTAPQEAASR